MTVKSRPRVRIPPSAPRRSKVRFAPTSFYACGKKDVIRPLPCSSFPTATRCAGLAVGGPPCGRPFSRLRNIDFNRPVQQSLGNTGFPRLFLFLSQTSEQRAKRQKSQYYNINSGKHGSSAEQKLPHGVSAMRQLLQKILEKSRVWGTKAPAG